MTYSVNGTNLDNFFESRDGAPLNSGWQTDSLGDWINTGAGWSVVTPSDAPVSPTCLQYFGSGSQDIRSEQFSADPNKTYRVSGWFRQIGSATNQYLLVGFYNSSGSLITNITTPNNNGLGWPAAGTYNYYSVVNTFFPNAWTFYSFEFGAERTAKLPPTATSMSIGALLSRDSSTSEIIQINSYRIEELNASAPLSGTVTNYFDDGTNFSQIFQPLSHDSRIPDVTPYFENGTNLARLYKANILQYSISAKVQSTRTSAWNGIITAACQVTFSSTLARTEFFVFGGRILISASRSGGSSSAKNNEWTAILNNAGRTEVANTISLRNTQSVVSGIGNTDLTTSFQQLYATSGGAYANASYSVAARIISATVVEVSVQLTDGASGVIDENIDGTLQVFFEERRHFSQASPTFAISSNL